MSGIVLIGHVCFSGGLHQFLFVYYKYSSEAGGNPEFSVGILKQVISPVGVIGSCTVYNVVVYKLVGIIIVAVDTAVGGYP